MLRIKKIMLLIMLCFCGIGAFAVNYDYEDNGFFYAITSFGESNEMSLVKCTAKGAVSIPVTVSWENRVFFVTSIGNSAFESNTDVTSVKIPITVASLGYDAFSGCTNLVSVDIPASVKSIGPSCFANCSSLVSVDIPSGITTIESCLFSCCSSLRSINIPNTVTSIGSGAFQVCQSLAEIEIPNTIEIISEWAFYYCTALKSCKIPDSVTTIERKAFQYCTSLTSVEIPTSVTSIEGLLADDAPFGHCTSLTSVVYNAIDCDILTLSSIFSDCPNLANVTIGNQVEVIPSCIFLNCDGITSIEIPNSVKKIGYRSFGHCSGLRTLEIPDNVTLIEGQAFCNCTGLESLKLSESVATIKSGAFEGCTGLKSLTIPKSAVSIGSSAFGGCGLEDVRVFWANPAGLDVDANAFGTQILATLFVPIGSLENYRTRTPWCNFFEIKDYIQDDNEGGEKCSLPVIAINDRQLVFTSDTPGAQFYYSIQCEDQCPFSDSGSGIVGLSGVYQIYAYAYAEGYAYSDMAKATLVWLAPTKEPDGLLSVDARKAILIKSVGDSIQICGTEVGETIQVFTVSGMLLHTQKALDGETLLSCGLQPGETYVIKYSESSIKYRH